MRTSRTTRNRFGNPRKPVTQNEGGEFDHLPDKPTPVDADLAIIEDSADKGKKKRVSLTDFLAAGAGDADAIHDNVAGEIAAIAAEKLIPINADLILIEDSASGNVKKKVQVGNLPSGGGPGSAQLARVYITGVTSPGLISSKTYEITIPAQKILTAFTSDSSDLTITLEIHSAEDGWMPPDVKLEGGGIAPVTVAKGSSNPPWVQLAANLRIWTVAITVADAGASGTFIATLPAGGGGDTSACTYTRVLDPPLITGISWENQGAQADVYPDGTYTGQSAFKNGDNMKVQGTCEAHATAVYIKDFDVTSGRGLQGPFTVTAGVFDSTTDAGLATVKAGTGNNAVAKLKVYAVQAVGADGPDFTSAGSVNKNNTAPTVPVPSIDYTVGVQPSTAGFAMRAGGTCDVTSTITNHTTSRTLYTAINANVLEPADGYLATKTWTHNGAAGIWWDSVDGNNARIVAHNDVNDLSTTRDFVIDIENDVDFAIPVGSTGGSLYQGAQVCVGDSDAFRLVGTTEARITNIRVTRYVDYAGVGTSVAGPADDDKVVSGTVFDFESNARTANVRDGAFNPRTCFVDIEVKIGGGWRTRHKVVDNHNTYGSIEVDTQTVPTFSAATVGNYPAGQTALKGTEDATVAITHTNINGGETYLYTGNGRSDINVISQTQGGVSDTTTYDVTKWCKISNPGVYNVNANNFRLAVTQPTYNGMSAAKIAVVKIGDKAAVIALSNNGESSPKVFRSQASGNKTYTITASCDQNMNEVTIDRDAVDDGLALGAWGGGPSTWTATITIADADTKNVAGASHDFEATGGVNWGKNIANFATTVAPVDTAYRVAGFSERSISMSQFQEYKTIGTMVTNRDNPVKVGAEAWDSLDTELTSVLTYKANTTQNNGGREFTITDNAGVFKADGDNVRCTDGELFNLPYTLRVKELA